MDLKTIKKQKGIYTGAVEVMIASFPSRPGQERQLGDWQAGLGLQLFAEQSFGLWTLCHSGEELID